MKMRQIIVGGDSPPAVIGIGEDGSVWVLEVRVSDVAMRTAARASSIAEGLMGQGQHLDYYWRRIPDPQVQS